MDSVVAALEAGKNIALANKECFVAAGEILRELSEKSTSTLAPLDSEHNSIFQCLTGNQSSASINKIILTASGGPFLNSTRSALGDVTPADALCHPKWQMGKKISIDSATMMNKGLEVIEAAMMFDLPGEKIEVLVHPQSLVHGLVEYCDGTLLAALFETDMKVPICHALGYLRNARAGIESTPRVLKSGASFLELAKREALEFFSPDYEQFPALKLSYQVLEAGGSLPAVLNAANEIAVDAFLSEMIGFNEIYEVVNSTVQAHRPTTISNIEEVIAIDAGAREFASKTLRSYAA